MAGLATAAPASDPAAIDDKAWSFRTDRYAWYVVFILCVGNMLSMLDRQIINLLVEPIKADLAISDTQISILQGFAFAVFYAAAAIPLGRLVDSWSRRNIVFGGALLFSAATFICGSARSFVTLFVGRMAVGVGEATLTPGAFSLIGDYIRRHRIAFAISLFVGSSYVGGGFALVVVGAIMSVLSGVETELPLLGLVKDWQLAFMLVSLPGVLFAFLLLVTVKEPPRVGVTEAAPSVPLREIGAFLWQRIALFAPVLLGLPLLAGANFAMNAWAPSFFIRTHGYTPAEIGPILGLMVMGLSTGGVVLGGLIADRMVARGSRDAYLKVPLFASLFALPFAVAYPLVGSPGLALALIAPVVLIGAVPFGAGSAAIPALAPNRMRGQLTALYMLLANLIGGGFGPWTVAAFTDNVVGDAALIRYSMAVVPTTLFAIGALTMLLGIRGMARAELKAG